ncbi:MAG: UDP-3-O-(3-hydroxymyristoyl)glucosamine N-acyltransferase [Kangiellaceae bacterium]|nr:UDP-3-O-(3-hydroxymyristoyl)glucosamine N-acyltransferase [Kangiellaceae bacterium]
MQATVLTVAEIAKIVGGKVEGDGRLSISAVASLDVAQPHEISFLSNPKFEEQLNTTQSGCVLLSNDYKKTFANTHIRCENPYLAFALVSLALNPNPKPATAISKSACIHSTAKLGVNVCLGDSVSISKDCVIEDNVVIGANSTIGEGTKVQANTVIYANVAIYHGVDIGKDCIIHSGTVIGSDGFGYANDAGQWTKIAQTGGVVIGNNVEIGANTTIDRGALNDTIIKTGVKIDNLCHIAHNVEVGENTAMAAFTGIAGSTVIGKSCAFSGRSSIIGHLNIADGTHLTAGTLVSKSNHKAGVFSSGTGAQENKQWRKNVARFKQLDEMAKKIRLLEKKVNQLERGESH